ncbi:hypothetical protein RO3G_02687 [Lichtheimia corymbifera JMRC:FSU:9682]|uniref:CCHC-type domain-containing protein n=1 Tax=Lichtheimia corymbifera JMRC:FSU:9682 TaxID=1263082 RepID=A0A068SIM9_9FUNG|nr:hypothetical protein RO3G_02687 [Lichtheimia corymbifera JMRC:FSU:9682]
MNPIHRQESYRTPRPDIPESDEEDTTVIGTTVNPGMSDPAIIQVILEQLRNQQEELILLRRERQEIGSTASNIKAVKPDVFRGERSTGAVEAWLHTVQKYCELTRLNDQERVLFASTLLRDSAATWWRHLETSIDENTGETEAPKDWSDFKDLFRKEFRPSNATQMARQRLEKLKQQDSIRDYIIEFRNIMLDLPDMFEEDAVHQFIQGLQYEPRLQVFLRTPTSLKEAYSAAEAYEAAVECARGIRDPPVNNPRYGYNNHHGDSGFQGSTHATRSTTDGPTPMDLDALYNNRKNNHRGFGKRSGTIQCHNCQGYGHIARQCPSPRLGDKNIQPLKGKAWRV